MGGTIKWVMDAEVAEEFFRRCEQYHASSEQQRVAILRELAEEGKMKSVSYSESSKEKVIEELKKNFSTIDAADLLHAQWCWDSETGDRVLVDRKTNKEIMREQYKFIKGAEGDEPPSAA